MSIAYKTADWKAEKHVPVIDCADSVAEGGCLDVVVSVGKEIAHPNTVEHHIRWIRLYFVAEGAGLPIEVATFEFTSHGEGVAFTEPKAAVNLSLTASGTLIATSYCNIHGLWESEKAVTVG